uniref:MYB transcription factor n=1 Tax=Fagus sylvatica TaxID=28930 RepID=A0A2N9HFV7_FAGSY
MGNPKQKWTAEEEEALRAGVAKHGTGKWKDIQRDPQFNVHLASRSNIDLKDKWRNMSVSAGGQGPREKSRTSKSKANPEAPSTSASNVQPSVAASVAHDTAADPNMDDASRSLTDGKNAPESVPEEGQHSVLMKARNYNAMILEAISTSKEPNGLDTSKILSFIELVHNNCYIMKSDASPGTKTPTPKQDILQPKPLQSISYVTVTTGDTVEAAAETAAYKIAEAENKAFVAAEAVKEAERISKMAEDTDSFLQLAKEIFEKCSRGEIVIMA